MSHGSPSHGPGSSKSSRKKSAPNSRSRRRLAREKADAGYSEQSHPRHSLADVVDVEALTGKIAPVVQQFGLVLEEVAARGAGNGQTLAVVVDLQEDQQGAVSLDTLAEVSQAVSAALDEDPEEPESAYLLEVTSPGATRKLTEPRHFKRARGHLVRFRPTEGEAFLARLEETDGHVARIRRKKNTSKGQPESYRDPEELDLDALSGAQVEVEFNRDLLEAEPTEEELAAAEDE